MSMDKREFVSHCGVEVQALEVWLEQQWIVPEYTASGPAFSDVDVARVRLIQDLSGELGVNDAGVDVILHLVDQLHGLRRALAALRETYVDRAHR